MHKCLVASMPKSNSKSNNSSIIKLVLILFAIPFVVFLFPLLVGGFVVYQIAKKLPEKNDKLIYGSIIILLALVSQVFWINYFSEVDTSETTLLETPEIVDNNDTTSSAISEEIPEETSVSGETFYDVTSIVDGDTIKVNINNEVKTVRLIGIDTPETVDPNRPVECFGQEASDKMKDLLTNKQVKLEKDVSETDKYGRLLRYVYLDEIFVNEYMVREGYANASSYPPDIKYQEVFNSAENEARDNNRGLWGEVCNSIEEDQSTKEDSEIEENQDSTPPTIVQEVVDCVIKGNIASDGEKIFHVPGCASYSRTIIDESKGERWFCTEQEALNAGWRKALNCP